MLLEIKGVTKRFGGLAALKNVSFQVDRGEIFGLIGPNGAGKTTMVHLMSRLLPVSDGEIWYMGENITRLPSHKVAFMGIARTFQIVKPFHGLTVRENVAVGALFGKQSGVQTIAKAMHRADEIIEFTGLGDVKNKQAMELPLARLKRIEMARALAMNPTLLLLDEVMAGLNSTEVEEMMDLIRQINQKGVTIIAIEHVMRAIMGISHRIMVLHHGDNLAVGTPEEISNNERVIEAYLGQRYSRAKKERNSSDDGLPNS